MLWLDGMPHATTRVPFDVADRGLLLGDGLFDTALVLDGRMVWRDAHVARLAAAARVLGLPLDVALVNTAIDALAGSTERGSLRLTLTRGAGPRGLAPSVDAKSTLFATVQPLRAASLFAPLTLHMTSIRRNDTSPLSRLKSLCYLDGILAMREALAAGCDDALFLNTRDRVACTSIGNIFALFGQQVVTPPVADGVLPGVVRGVLLRACDDLGLEPVERSLAIEDLARADDLLVTNSLRLIAPVRAIGRRRRDPPSDRAEALIASIARLVREESGIDPRALAEL